MRANAAYRVVRDFRENKAHNATSSAFFPPHLKTYFSRRHLPSIFGRVEDFRRRDGITTAAVTLSKTLANPHYDGTAEAGKAEGRNPGESKVVIIIREERRTLSQWGKEPFPISLNSSCHFLTLPVRVGLGLPGTKRRRGSRTGTTCRVILSPSRGHGFLPATKCFPFSWGDRVILI